MRGGRITPAYAGKSPTSFPCPRPAPDHPRVCGEKWTMPRQATLCTGSPPRMRGKVLCRRGAAGRHGITPAYAGKRQCAKTRYQTIRDHPRVCGEKTLPELLTLKALGSPPRMRGKVLAALGAAHLGGITPAYAGKSYYSELSTFLLRDHPRVCGEKFSFTSGLGLMLGSPPRMRGKEHS